MAQQESRALLVHADLQEFLVLRGRQDLGVIEVHRDHQEEEVHEGVMDLKAAQVCTFIVLLLHCVSKKLPTSP